MFIPHHSFRRAVLCGRRPTESCSNFIKFAIHTKRKEPGGFVVG